MDKQTIDYLKSTYPDVITKDQFYRICHISKKTASYLLDNGLVPCTNSGKQTRKYKIRLDDVIAFLDARENNRKILELCKKYEVPVILGSDAHVSFDIANYEHLYALLQETEFPEGLIMNRSVEMFKNYLKKY